LKHQKEKILILKSIIRRRNKNEHTEYINYISENLQLNFDPKKKIKKVYDPQELIKNSLLWRGGFDRREKTG
jgi:hypothetical protein